MGIVEEKFLYFIAFDNFGSQGVATIYFLPNVSAVFKGAKEDDKIRILRPYLKVIRR